MLEVIFIYHQDLCFRHEVLSVDCDISNKLCVVHSNHVTETQDTLGNVFRVHITSADTKILVFVPCILFLRFLVISEQTAIISLCSIERFFFVIGTASVCRKW
jgi:hypothetical protein